ncbi:probable pseudouridine-5'-phosphatase [Galendromus occidentalis]|uniref:Probable pseudouridine-5'-phosphatase n=1 Tax=Galendromus occidentalis TaxID=34638 RepID=A0AAJ6QQ02_9ACAR|nr:probable pseudouridine-5'-phosphatase [Galendromus occidentalis]
MTFKPVTHCIFDLDGTLVDSERIYFKAIDSVLRKYGHRHSTEMCRKINGTTRAEYSRILVEDCGLPISAEEFLDQMDAIAQGMLENVELLPGVQKLVTHLKNHNIPMAIGTSSAMKSVTAKLSKHKQLMECFDHLVSGSSDPEVTAGKPAPDVFLVTARRFKPAADVSKVLVFEDSLNGVLSGLAAGMQVVMIPDPDIVTEDQRKIPTLCLESLADFKPELFGLPPF